ncbi:hypothetical protein [Bradyrhizobium sp. STM 3809]|uniref:hypothetical protein n=1 Tax=Bradyrhizobium sp. STM 3809 TaxID=551936 RepID=UPI00024088FE|nr:hypothetical protein [Bradyrhizobium sp. STM 3809]CCE00598.1 conserved hypothetical protein [Bradyrhizobium sp. STM 3809]
MQPQRARAEWWSRAPADFEECADAAEKSATKEEKTTAMAQCNAKFAGRRKPGGGYVYYDFMQDRSFDIAGPNPTPEEQKFIDQQYTQYLERQRHANMSAAMMPRTQPQGLQPASIKDMTARAAIEPPKPALPAPPPPPLPRPSKPPAAAQQTAPTAVPGATAEARARIKAAQCAKDGSRRDSFSCNFPVLSEKLDDLKRLFTGPSQTATATPVVKPPKRADAKN